MAMMFSFQPMVRIQDINTTAIPLKAAPPKITNNSLPKEVMEGKVWSNVIIPTMILWAGSQRSAWNFSEDDFMEALRITCQHYIDGIDLDSWSSSSAICKLVSPDSYLPMLLLTSNTGNSATYRPLAKRHHVICHGNDPLVLCQPEGASN